MLMFKNTRTGASADELIAYKTEDEQTAQSRFKAAGWNFTGDFYWDETSKKFLIGKEPSGEEEPMQDE
jgi:hypothetical protein